MYSTLHGTGDGRTAMNVSMAPHEELHEHRNTRVRSPCNGEGTGVAYSPSELNICKQNESGVNSIAD